MREYEVIVEAEKKAHKDKVKAKGKGKGKQDSLWSTLSLENKAQQLHAQKTECCVYSYTEGTDSMLRAYNSMQIVDMPAEQTIESEFSRYCNLLANYDEDLIKSLDLLSFWFVCLSLLLHPLFSSTYYSRRNSRICSRPCSAWPSTTSPSRQP